MGIQVLFFGATAEATGKRQITVEVPKDSKAKSAFDKMLSEYPQLTSHRLHFSINQQFATGDEILQDGDEVAIFSAVSGG